MWDIILNIKENKTVLEKKTLKKRPHAYGYNNFTSHKENRVDIQEQTYEFKGK